MQRIMFTNKNEQKTIESFNHLLLTFEIFFSLSNPAILELKRCRKMKNAVKSRKPLNILTFCR